VYFSLIHQRTTRTSNKEIEQGHRISSGSKTYRATLVTIVKKYWRLKQRFYTSTPSQTVHLLTLLALPLLTIASNAAPLRRILRHTPSRIAPPSTSLPFKLPSRSLTIFISRYRQSTTVSTQKTPSLIVARRTRAAVEGFVKVTLSRFDERFVFEPQGWKIEPNFDFRVCK